MLALITAKRYQNTSLVTSTSSCLLRCRAPSSDLQWLPWPNWVGQPMASPKASVDQQPYRPAHCLQTLSGPAAGGAPRSMRPGANHACLGHPVTHGCPKLVKPIHLTDIGICYTMHVATAAAVCSSNHDACVHPEQLCPCDPSAVSPVPLISHSPSPPPSHSQPPLPMLP
jgi:hypothetical protein